MRNSNKVYDVKVGEIKQAAATLYQAFFNDPFMHWSFLSKNNYIKYGFSIIETWVKYSVLYGKAFRTENFESIVLYRKPRSITHPYNSSYWRKFRSGVLNIQKTLPEDMIKRFKLFGEISRNERNKNMGDQLFWYFWVLGTAPEHQNQGYGSILIDYTSSIKNKLPCCLTTTTEAAKRIYCRKRYSVLSEIILPESDIKLTSMVRY